MDKKKMMITAGVMAGVGYGMYKYLKNNKDKFSVVMHNIKDMASAVKNFEDDMM